MLVRKNRLVLKVSADGERVGFMTLFAGYLGMWFQVGQQICIGGRWWFDVRRGRVFSGVRLDPAGNAGHQGSLKLKAGAYYGVRERSGTVDIERLRPESVREVKCEQILQLAGFDHFTNIVRNNLTDVSANAYNTCVTDGEKLADGSIRGGTFALFGKRAGDSQGFEPAAAVITSETEPSDLLLTLASNDSYWSGPALCKGSAQEAATTA